MEEEKDFEEKPIPLITDGFDLDNDGIEFLQKLSDKSLSVISVIGPSASGKSFLANQLSGQVNKGFEIGSIENRKECCTKGIWVWGKPIIKDNNYIIILDAQGFRTDTDENLEYSQKIFALCCLISSIVIYNYKKDDGSEETSKISNEVIEHSYDLFNKLIPFLEKIKLEDNEELSEDVNKLKPSHIPEFIWVYRDYLINDFSAYDELENKITENNTNFNLLFKNKIKKYSLPCPLDSNQMLVNTYLDIDEEEIKKSNPFNEDYQTSFNNFKKKVIKNCQPKIIANLNLNGNLFYGILQEYASSIFSGEYMYVESPLTNVVFSNLGEITEGINESFKEKLEEKNKNVPDFIQQMKNSVEVISDGLLNDYHNAFIGKLLHSQFLTEELINIISSASDELFDTYINEKLNKFNEELKELTEKESKEKILKIESVPDIKKNLNALSANIKSQLEEKIFTKDNEFLSSYSIIKDYIIKCVLNKINLYADSINFYIDHNLQSIENSSKSNEAALEAKVQELIKKEAELIDMNINVQKMERNLKEKEDEYKVLLQSEKDKYKMLEKNLQSEIEQKNAMIERLNNKCQEIDKEINNYYNAKNINDEITKLKNENFELKLQLGNKEKQLNNVNKKYKELGENNSKENNNKELNLKNLKDSDIPKLKETFKKINKTISDYAERVNKLEQNRDMVFHDKFIEFSKSTLNKICKNWNEELSQFKEDHFKTMVSSYRKEISDLKKDNAKFLSEIESLYNEINEKNIEILKIKEELKFEKEKTKIKEDQIKTIENKYDVIQKEIEIHKVRIKDKENTIIMMGSELSKYKSAYNIKDDEFENFKGIVNNILLRNEKQSLKEINKLENGDSKELLEWLFKEIINRNK